MGRYSHLQLTTVYFKMRKRCDVKVLSLLTAVCCVVVFQSAGALLSVVSAPERQTRAAECSRGCPDPRCVPFTRLHQREGQPGTSFTQVSYSSHWLLGNDTLNYTMSAKCNWELKFV